MYICNLCTFVYKVYKFIQFCLIYVNTNLYSSQRVASL